MTVLEEASDYKSAVHMQEGRYSATRKRIIKTLAAEIEARGDGGGTNRDQKDDRAVDLAPTTIN